MRFPLLDPTVIFKGVRYEFLRVNAPGRSGFKTVSVHPLDNEACGMVIDLDAEGTERSIVRVKVETVDALRISTYVLNQELVDIVTRETPKPKEKKEDETQH